MENLEGLKELEETKHSQRRERARSRHSKSCLLARSRRQRSRAQPSQQRQRPAPHAAEHSRPWWVLACRPACRQDSCTRACHWPPGAVRKKRRRRNSLAAQPQVPRGMPRACMHAGGRSGRQGRKATPAGLAWRGGERASRRLRPPERIAPPPPRVAGGPAGSC